MEPQRGFLYIVGTPIGNLEDISQRLVNTLSKVDVVYAEDTRVAKKLLSHLDEIKVIDFDHSDVVRHPLVSKIVKAYSSNDDQS